MFHATGLDPAFLRRERVSAAGFGEVGPFGSYAPLGHLSKAILTALMLLGRIEIVPLAVLLRRSYWHA
ncbi:hypothetical protein ACFWH4_29980 [Streptomyces sp. NPDC127091]|uniref:hypothetical protein n=1 Tax=Streptomyces sp. NPDC127091 TaxID=3347134 RepID=UPI003660F630